MLARVLLSLVAGVLALLIGEGLLSLLLDTSVRDLLSGEDKIVAVAPREQRDEERFAAAARNPGCYRVHDDPRVGYALKSSLDDVVVDNISVRSDALGLRRRPTSAAPIEEEALRIVVLGDSVAFGWNLSDEETLAARLEVALNTVRGPDARPVRCRTVAVPGWNLRNAVYFLLDHYDELRPDHVLFMPVNNDLEDTDGVYSTGHRRNQADPSNPDPWVNVNQNYRYLTTLAGRSAQATGQTLGLESVGPAVLISALSLESNRRVEEAVATLLDLQRRLQRLGATLHLACHDRNEVYRLLRARLAQQASPIPDIPMLEKSQARDTQIGDPHPHAEAVQAFALWAAEDLLKHGVVERHADQPLPKMPEGYAARRSPPWSDAEAIAWLESKRASSRAALRNEISDITGHGARQIYGGILLDGSMGPHLLALLPRKRRLEVALAPLRDRPDLYPLRVRVEVDGHPLGSLDLLPELAAEEVVATFDLPETTADCCEVRLIAEHWGMRGVFGKSRPSSCDFRWLKALD